MPSWCPPCRGTLAPPLSLWLETIEKQRNNPLNSQKNELMCWRYTDTCLGKNYHPWTKFPCTNYLHTYLFNPSCKTTTYIQQSLLGNSISNHPMISPTISDLSETLHTASPLLVYCILKVTAHSIGYFSRNSISIFKEFSTNSKSDISEICPLQRFSNNFAHYCSIYLKIDS